MFFEQALHFRDFFGVEVYDVLVPQAAQFDKTDAKLLPRNFHCVSEVLRNLISDDRKLKDAVQLRLRSRKSSGVGSAQRSERSRTARFDPSSPIHGPFSPGGILLRLGLRG